MEKLARLQRQLHRKEPWQLSSAGLWVKTCYAERQPDDLSWWDDVGFVLNRRRVIVWWQHPRAVYADEISERAWELAKPYEPQRTTNLLSAGTPNYQRVGKSRKKSFPTPVHHLRRKISGTLMSSTPLKPVCQQKELIS